MTQIELAKGAPSPFWTFSLAVYGLQGVPPACLTLQDSSGVDVNVLLFSLFLGRCGRALAVEDAARIAGLVEPWRAGIVVPTRVVRRALKEPPAPFEGPAVEQLRKTIKGTELEAERIQQEMLFVSFPVQTTGRSELDLAKACAQNVEAYRLHLGATFDEKAVAMLLDAAAQTMVRETAR